MRWLPFGCLGVAMLLACDDGSSAVGGDAVLESLELTPASATLAPGDSVQFSVTGEWSDGGTSVPPVTYTATGGTISPAGRYRAGAAAGAYRVVAVHAASLRADTAPVTITATPPVLQSLTLSPATATLPVGDSVQFSVAAVWSDGGTVVPPVTYTATGGTISTSGLYRAGAAPGAYRVVARHEPSGRADTSAVTITPGGTSGTVLLREPFEDPNATARGWYDNAGSWTLTTTDPHGGARALVWAWTQGAVLPGFGAAARFEFAPTDQVYVSYWVKYSSNWVGSGVAYHPHEFQLLTTVDGRYTGPSFTHLTTYIEHVYGAAGGVPQIGTTDGANIDVSRVGQDLSNVTEARATAGCNGNTDGIPTDCYALGGGGYNNGKWMRPAGNAPAFLPNPGPGYKGDWHHVEVLFRMNTIVNGIGQTNGLAQYWFDGQLVIDRRNVLFRTGAHPTMMWNQFLMGPYIGVGSPVAQSAWVDDLVIATGRQ